MARAADGRFVPRRAADDGEGLACGTQEAVAFAHCPGVRWLVREFDARWRRHVAGIGQHVLWQGDDRRAGAIRQRGVKGVCDHGRNAAAVVDFGDELGHAAVEVGEVELLKGVAAPRCAFHLAGEEHERRRVLLRDVNAGAGVGGAGAAGDEDDAGTPRELGVRLGHHGRAALLPRHHGVDGGIAQGVEDGEIAFAGNAEDALHALFFQGIHEGLGGGSGDHLGFLRFGSRLGGAAVPRSSMQRKPFPEAAQGNSHMRHPASPKSRQNRTQHLADGRHPRRTA